MLFRTCTKCTIQKPMSEYFRDPKGLEGYSARCKICKTASRKPKVSTPKPTPSPSIAPESVFSVKKVTEPLLEKIERPRAKVKVVKEKSVFDRLTEKYNACYTITRQVNGKTLVQVHSNPGVYLKAYGDIEEALETLVA